MLHIFFFFVAIFVIILILSHTRSDICTYVWRIICTFYTLINIFVFVLLIKFHIWNTYAHTHTNNISSSFWICCCCAFWVPIYIQFFFSFSLQLKTNGNSICIKKNYISSQNANDWNENVMKWRHERLKSKWISKKATHKIKISKKKQIQCLFLFIVFH